MQINLTDQVNRVVGIRNKLVSAVVNMVRYMLTWQLIPVTMVIEYRYVNRRENLDLHHTHVIASYYYNLYFTRRYLIVDIRKKKITYTLPFRHLLHEHWCYITRHLLHQYTTCLPCTISKHHTIIGNDKRLIVTPPSRNEYASTLPVYSLLYNVFLSWY